MPVPSVVAKVHDDIHSMRTRGAAKIGRAAVAALAQAFRRPTTSSLPEFRKSLLHSAKHLAAARPTAVTLRNGLNRVLTPAMEAASPSAAVQALQAAAKAYEETAVKAQAAIARHALALFDAGDIVLTHCHSTTAGAAIIAAHKARKGIRAISTETRPFQQGHIQAPALAAAGVPTMLIVDSAVTHAFEDLGVAKVVVGADAVDAQGGLYNKIGTRQVAELARRFRKPFYCMAETEKFNPYTLQGEVITIEEREAAEIVGANGLKGVTVHNPVFDRTPPRLITRFVTEAGLLRPRDVPAFLRRSFKDVRKWV